jgi:hypothetical protein
MLNRNRTVYSEPLSHCVQRNFLTVYFESSANQKEDTKNCFLIDCFSFVRKFEVQLNETFLIVLQKYLNLHGISATLRIFL